MPVQAVPPLWADVQGDGLEDLMAGEKDIARRELVLGLDPSSTICGYAAMGSRREVVSVGWLKPGCRDDNSFERDMAMCDDLVTLLEELRPTTILIEWPKGKVHEGRHHGRGAGLAVYGTGVGAIARQAVVWARSGGGCDVVPILDTVWTRGIPKVERQRAIACEVPEYAPHMGEDPGGDMSDAIGLCLWWLAERSLLFS
jgi:hypothetical protein